MVKAIVGANWGDEGKGKITDMFAAESDIVIRFQGGSNAGHTIINDLGKFSLHLLPSGVFFPHIVNIIGNGVAFDIDSFLTELDTVRSKGVTDIKLMISDRAQILMPYHIMFDTYEEERLAGKSFGSTKSGIAPFYSDKYAKIGIQISELFDEEKLYDKLKNICSIKNVTLEHLYHKPLINADELFRDLIAKRELIKPYIADTFTFIRNALADNKKILLEGQLGSLRDVDFGIYPFTTSSSPVAGFGSIGAGIPPYEIKNITVVTKAYSSCVGAGPFVPELFGAEGDELRKRGGDAGEYGAKTGRPRRVGWFDCVATRYGCKVQGATECAMTNIDVLSYLDEIPVCTAYELDGVIINDFPTTNDQYRAKPVIKMLPGWKKDIRGIKSEDELPKEAKDYIKFVEEQIKTPITILSTGPKRDEYIFLKK